MRRRWYVIATAFILSVTLVAACGSSAHNQVGGTGPSRQRYSVYWDQNEEEDFLSLPSGQHGQLVAPWNPNGQLCLLPHGNGPFTTGYNPTLPSQHNPGSLKPAMQPPVGEAMWDRHGQFTGKTIYVPGAHHLPGQTVGGDIPPDQNSNAFNNNGTYTGCAFDRHGNLFASDLGTAQGQFPPPDDGRLIEWFAPSYTSFCVVFGPTAGGDGAHHVDGTGGLRQPGDLAFDQQGNLLLPEAGALQGSLPAGRVLRLDHGSLPGGAADCGPDGLYPRDKLRYSVFFQGNLSLLPFPVAIAPDPTCNCWAISSTIGDPAIAWVDGLGHPVASHPSIPGESIARLGKDPNAISPFGLAFAPDGTLYVVDIHIICRSGLGDCGPESKAGRVMKVTFNAGRPDAPTPIATGLDFPTSVTVCEPNQQTCPSP
ncbi:MAG TPA: hypothetical protein VLL25_07200 [Acidimicrobiales bacterium]|nr:hypothetical protein [Acidimicrobiales bacterium]